MWVATSAENRNGYWLKNCFIRVAGFPFKVSADAYIGVTEGDEVVVRHWVRNKRVIEIRRRDKPNA